MTHVPLIVIGASAGGLDAIADLLGELSPKIPAAILIVIHIGETASKLPDFFKTRSPLPVSYAQDDAPIEAANVYFAPPDRHLIVEPGRLRLGRGPRENHARPAVDPLFRSAAEVYGPLVIGVVLTGYLTDGTAGLWEVKRRGGIAIVQDPGEAEVPSMPSSARQHVAVDYCLGVKAIGQRLNSLAAEAVKKAPQSASNGGEPEMEYTADNPVALTCSTCGGALRKMTKGTYTQYRCHIGHTFGTLELANEQFEHLRAVLESSARLLNERGKFFRAIAGDARRSREEQAARPWDEAAEESEVRFDGLTKLLEADWKRPDLMPASNGKLKPRDARNEARGRHDDGSATVPRPSRRIPKSGRAATSKRGGNGRKALI